MERWKCRLLQSISSNQCKIFSLIWPQFDGLGAVLKGLRSPQYLQ